MSPIRPAVPADVSALVAIENLCFPGNRLDRRRFLYQLRTANSATLVDAADGEVRGYVLLLFRRNSLAARIYSIATHPLHTGKGIAAALVCAAEQLARERGLHWQRLEVRQDNAASLSLFQRHGYRIFGSYADYYHDGMDAVRLEKELSLNQ
ncbi:GNAT family N-acetyltransferase [Massilia sp. BJB1822]|nr:GNAT family N-acetyltransferase [Massilia sp. BJB1822]